MKKTKLITFLAVMLFTASITNVAMGQTRNISVGVDVDNTSSYQPTQIANGDFRDMPSMEGWGDNRIPNNTNEGWNTTETGYNCFEYLCDYIDWVPYILTDNNCMVEMNADNEAALYQDLFTKGGDVIRWSLKHAVRDDPYESPQTQAIRVEIGAPNYDEGDIVYPHGINNDIHTEINNNTKASYVNYGITNPSAGTYGYAGEYDLDGLSLDKDSDIGDWHNATGVYIIPENQNVTRFAFVSYGAEEGECASCGNFLDDITFSTLIGNLSAVQLANGNVELKGYWGETDDEKHLVVKFGSHTENVDMKDVREKNFIITILKDDIGNATSLTVYHQDYYAARRTITIHSYSQSITGYTSEANGWYLIASPIGTTVSPSDVTNMTTNTYDIFRFNQSAEMEWQNWEQTGASHNHFDLEPGRGYLYANSQDVDLTFVGTPYSGNGVVNLEYSTANSDSRMHGWNLIGNPFGTAATVDKASYKMNGDRDGFEAQIGGASVAAMEGVFVQATATGQKATFTVQTRGAEPAALAYTNIVVSSDNGKVLDNAIIRFDDGETLGKFQLRENSTKVYISVEGKDYAIANADSQSEMPLNFKAEKNGNYTLSLSNENIEFGYMHLIDNLTGADIDLIATPSYTFEAKGDDYESRFKLVFSANDMNDNDNENFAFISNGQLIVNGTGTIQIIDIMGRVIVAKSTEERISTNRMTSGVYVLQLITATETKTQKIVVR